MASRNVTTTVKRRRVCVVDKSVYARRRSLGMRAPNIANTYIPRVASSIPFAMPVRRRNQRWIPPLLLVVVCCFATSAMGQNVTSSPSIAPQVPPTGNESLPLDPTLFPTSSPTISPVQAPMATAQPTEQPSYLPSWSPSVSPEPTVSARPSQTPSSPPTMRPTQTFMPSAIPTVEPSDVPSSVPSNLPSSNPTHATTSVKRANYRQSFLIPINGTFFNTTQQLFLMSLYESYTDQFPVAGHNIVEVECVFGNQDQSVGTESISLTITFQCTWTSIRVIVQDFGTRLVTVINENLEQITLEVQEFADIIAAQSVSKIVPITPAPTITRSPTAYPTMQPTISAQPSGEPSTPPTYGPTEAPTIRPSTVEPTFEPTVAPTNPPEDRKSLKVGAVVAILLIGVAGLALFVIFYFRLKRVRAARAAAARGAALGLATEKQEKSTKLPPSPHIPLGDDPMSPDPLDLALSPSESLLSNKSLLSAGESALGEESADELDGTKNLQDEFDQYKDQTLEQFRSNVEGNISGFEGIMSAAVTKALMGDDDTNVAPNELYWGFRNQPSGPEIEASALCDVSDWMKRNDRVTSEKKRAFMTEIVNKMMTSVRSGVVNAEDASRTVHECAALLALPLAKSLPMTTVIVSGMRKTVNAAQVMNVFKEFGDIDVAAVASGQRGFGIIRYRNMKSVDRAMRRYRGGEIVVQDVAIQMKVLKTSGTVES